MGRGVWLNSRGWSSFAAGNEPGATVVNFEPTGSTNAADDQGERIAPERVHGRGWIVTGGHKLAAQRQNRRRAGRGDPFGGSVVGAGEHASDDQRRDAVVE